MKYLISNEFLIFSSRLFVRIKRTVKTTKEKLSLTWNSNGYSAAHMSSESETYLGVRIEHMYSIIKL